MGTTVIAILSAAGASALTGLATIFAKLRPERANLNVEASEKAVKLLRSTLDELGDELEHARMTIKELQASLDDALRRARVLDRELELERGNVVRLQRKVEELERRHDAATA